MLRFQALPIGIHYSVGMAPIPLRAILGTVGLYLLLRHLVPWMNSRLIGPQALVQSSAEI